MTDQLSKAEECYETALGMTPENSDVLSNYGALKESQELDEEAEVCLFCSRN